MRPTRFCAAVVIVAGLLPAPAFAAGRHAPAHPHRRAAAPVLRAHVAQTHCSAGATAGP